MNIIDIIEKKKKGLRLSTEEIYSDVGTPYGYLFKRDG